MTATVRRKKNVAGFVDESGRFRPIRSPQYVGSRKATAKDRRKYSAAKAGDLGPARQERALEDVFDREIRLQREGDERAKREQARLTREFERDAAGDAGSSSKGQTLLEFVRSAGGVRRTFRHGGKKSAGKWGKRSGWDGGEIDRLSYKETGKRGLTTDDQRRGKTMDKMHQAALAAGYDVGDMSDLMDRVEREAAGGKPTYSTHGSISYNPKGRRKKNPDPISAVAQLASTAVSLMHLDEMMTKRAAKKKPVRRKAAKRNPAARVTKTRTANNPQTSEQKVSAAIKAARFLYTVNGWDRANAWMRKKYAEKALTSKQFDLVRREVDSWKHDNVTRRNPKPAANPRAKVTAHGGNLYVLTIKRGDDVEGIFLHDGQGDGFSKKFASLTSAKSWATRNKKKLVHNPSPAIKRKINGLLAKSVVSSQKPVVKKKANPTTKKAAPKKNGVLSRALARRRAAAELKRELRAEAKLERIRSRKAKAVKAAKKNPVKAVKKPNPAGEIPKGFYLSKGPYAGQFYVRRDGTNQILGMGSTRTEAITDARANLAKRLRRKANLAKLPPPRKTFMMFNGRRNEHVRPLAISRHAGNSPNVDQLGRLVEIKLMDGRIIKFNPARAVLAAKNGRMWIAGQKLSPPDRMQNPRTLNPIDHVDHVVYETFKPHHGDRPGTHYIHKLGEEGGLLPLLCVDNEGFPVLKGGSYKIRREGIRD